MHNEMMNPGENTEKAFDGCVPVRLSAMNVAEERVIRMINPSVDSMEAFILLPS